MNKAILVFFIFCTNNLFYAFAEQTAVAGCEALTEQADNNCEGYMCEEAIEAGEECYKDGDYFEGHQICAYDELQALIENQNTTNPASQLLCDYKAEDIYENLDVPAVSSNPGIGGASKTEKSVGGLVCTITKAVVPDAEEITECNLNAQNMDAEKIFKALKVKAVDVNSGIGGASKSEKSVEGLTCTKETAIVPGSKPTFSCTLQ